MWMLLFVVTWIIHANGQNITVLKTITTPNGFHNAARGWNSWGIQQNPSLVKGWRFTQEHVTPQCNVLAEPDFAAAGYKYCSLDSGWQSPKTDEYGRPLFDRQRFNIPEFAQHLHARGLLLGIYMLPGAYCEDEKKTIKGTNTTFGDFFAKGQQRRGGNRFGRCEFDYEHPEVQMYYNSVVDVFAGWGVDLIKLDFVTPGSKGSMARLVRDSSPAVIAYHQAIYKSGRPIRLDLSYRLDMSIKYYGIWKTNADSLRTDFDINNHHSSSFTSWKKVQQAIAAYRRYILQQVYKKIPYWRRPYVVENLSERTYRYHHYSIQQVNESTPLSIYPDMDNLYIGNEPKVSGMNNTQRRTAMNFWVGAGANLILGSDMTQLDDFGRKLLTNLEVMKVADFCAKYPVQPRNPWFSPKNTRDHWERVPFAGEDYRPWQEGQIQAWTGGPSNETGEAIIILVNYGPDEGKGHYNSVPGMREGRRNRAAKPARQLSGLQYLKFSLNDLGLSTKEEYEVVDVWANATVAHLAGNGKWKQFLDQGESLLWRLKPVRAPVAEDE